MAQDSGKTKLFNDVSAEDINNFIRDELGIEDPEEFQKQMRIEGPPGPQAHAIWHDVLTSMKWELQNYQDINIRLKPCFSLISRKHHKLIPVLVENYNFQPFDNEDDLANEAKSAMLNLNEPISILLFRSICFKEVNGSYFNFGGYVCKEGKISPFTINHRMRSVDEIFEQLESGFTFSNPSIEWEDEDATLALGFAKLCADLDANKPQKHVVMNQGEWSFIMCQPEVIQSLDILGDLNKVMSEIKKGFH